MGKFIDLTGKQFNLLKVLKRDEERPKGRGAYWICECECGKIISVSTYQLNAGQKSCGCHTHQTINPKDYIGKKFNKLTILERDFSKDIGHGKNSYWICECECGNKISVNYSQLTSGKTKSCGCLKKEILKEKNTLDLSNKRYGKLICLKNTLEQKRNSFLWECQCDCGNIVYKTVEELNSGKVNSCGCLNSIGESKIAMLLLKNNIKFQTQKTFSDLINENGNKLRYDFAILDENDKIIKLIEFDGEQHFKNLIRNDNGWNSEDNYLKTHKNDMIKNDYALKNNIPLIRIPCWKKMNIELKDILGEEFLV